MMLKLTMTAALAGIAVPAAAGEPNIILILLDDAGFAQSDAVGGAIHTPTFSRIADSGILYNAFHTTAISSATRAALLTGRNHHHVGNGTITELASETDGYTGTIPDNADTLPQLLRSHGYATAAFGKWHNTPVAEASPKGPFNHWPTGYGFDHFYGFLGAESDQYQPNLVNDTTPIPTPRQPGYHLSADLADQAIAWIDQAHAKEPGKPFFVYWAPGAVHAPHQVFKEWSDKYKGKFDGGWDAYRQAAFERQKAMGWIPADTKLTPRPAEMPAWDSLDAKEKAFQAREMEVFAGFLEHVDTQAGRIVDEIQRLGLGDNTMIVYMFSDNGASAEGMGGSINDIAGLTGIQSSPQESMAALDKYYGGLDALGGPKLHEHYSAAWAYASESPFYGTKLMAGYFGGTRTPLAISWPGHIKHDGVVRNQFLHVNDIAPTLYDVLGIAPPAEFNGVRQEPLDGVSFADSFANAQAPEHKAQQYFEMMGSRAEYADGWVAAVEGPRKPWSSDLAGLMSWPGKLAVITGQTWIGDRFGWMKWKPEQDQWALYDLRKDFSESTDVAAGNPQKLAALKAAFDADAKANHVLPIGQSFNMMFHPRDNANGPKTFRVMPEEFGTLEFDAPHIGSRSNVVTVEADLPEQASGVLVALGGIGGGVTLYLDKGVLTYEYNSFSLIRTSLSAPTPLPAGHKVISVEFKKKMSFKLSGPAEVILRVDGKEVGRTEVPITAPIAFSATEALDVGQDTGTAVSLAYYDRAPFRFEGTIKDVTVEYR
jgi:arylsulfatase A-like enzyme